MTLTRGRRLDPDAQPPTPERSGADVFNKIIWATDCSPTAERVLPVVKALAESAAAKLVVAHVHEHLSIGWTPIHDDEDRSLDARLQRTVDELTREGFDAELALTDSRPGHAAQVIADLAREAGADLIVAGTHGQGPVAGFFLGGFTIHLLKVASCPVLVVPREHQDNTRRTPATAPNTTFSKAGIPPQRTVVPAGADPASRGAHEIR